MHFRSLLMLASGLTLACTAGDTSGLQIKIAFPTATGFHTQAIPESTRAVPILVFQDGKMIDKAILTPRSPTAFFRGLPLGDVNLFAAGFARGGTPTAVGKGNAAIQPASLAKAEIVMRETSSDPDLDKFRPLLDEIKKRIESEFPSPAPSSSASTDPNLRPSPGASGDPFKAPTLDPTASATPTPAPAAGGGSSAPTIGLLSAFASALDTTLTGLSNVPAGIISFSSNDLVINGIDVGARAPTSGGNSTEMNARAIADLINTKTDFHKIRASTNGTGRVVLMAKNLNINLTLTASGVASTGLTGTPGSVTINKNPMNFYSGYPVLLKAPISGVPTETQVVVANGGRTAQYKFNGSQWLVTNPDPLTNSPIPLTGDGFFRFNSSLQEGHFGSPIVGGGSLSLVWHAPTITPASQTFNVTVTIKNAQGTASSAPLAVNIVKPSTTLVITNGTF